LELVIDQQWDIDIEAAQALQSSYAQRVIRWDAYKGGIKTVAGVDVAYGKQLVYAAALVLDAGSLQALETVSASDPVRFPYVPGLFSFRELPALFWPCLNYRSRRT